MGTGHDAMAVHNAQKFSTYDMDNDQSSHNCAYDHQGGWWWYNGCYQANLNGPHNIPPNPTVNQVHAKMMWYGGSWRDVSSSEMKIRVKGCIMPPIDSC